MKATIWLGVVLGFRAALLEGQENCPPPAVSLIFQERPVSGDSHETPEVFAEMVEAKTVEVIPGRVADVPLWAGIVSELEGTEYHGVQGLSVMISTKDAVFIRDITTRNTVADKVPEGLFQDGFSKVDLLINDSILPCVTSFASVALVFSLMEGTTLKSQGTATFLELTVASLDAQGTEPQQGRLGWEDYSCYRCPSGRGGNAGDGEGACGMSWSAVATIDGDSRPFCSRRPLELTFVPRTSTYFKRGDSNGDGKVDISDAVRTLMFLFQDASEPRCLDAADASDDGGVDITDAILTLLDFFRPGTGIPDPGPFDCGSDPTGDTLGCAAHTLCE